MTTDPATFDPVAFLERAVETPSTGDVTAMQALLVETLEAGGADPRVDAAGNVRTTRGSGRPHLLLNTHLDTVSPHVPFERAGDRVRGRGACDAKGPLAAMVAAFLAADVSSGTLSLAVTPDEEVLSTGAHALVTGEVAAGGPGATGESVDPLDAAEPPPAMVVVGEPTGLDVCTAARGRFEATVSLAGTAAHAADPASGTNAVAAAGEALRGLETFEGVDPHPSLGAPTLVATGVEGGEATNQVPAACEVTVDRRSVPPETADGFRAALERHLQGAVGAADCEVRLTPRETPFLEAFATDPDHPLVETLSAAAAGTADEIGVSGDCGGNRSDTAGDDAEFGCDSAGDRVVHGAVRPFGAATEASYFADVPTVVFGPGDLRDENGAVAHAEREYVDVREVRAAATALERTIDRLLAP